jgi:hypothetical protein
MRSRIACSVAAAAILAAGTARADPTAQQRAVAEALFKEAKALMKRGKIPEACEKLASSYEIDPAGGTLLNLAMCHEIEGKTATAWTEFHEALAMAKKAKRDDRQKAANEHIAALEGRLSRLTLALPAASAAPDLEVRVDGVVIAPAAIGTPIPVNPGDHVVAATAPGKKPWETKISLKESQNQALVLPVLESSAPPPPPEPPKAAASWQKPTGFAALGVGAVLLGVGTYFGVHAMSLGSKVTAECPKSTCSPAGWKALQDGRAAANVANGTLVAGGAVAAAGVTLVVVGYVTGTEPPRTGRAIEVVPAAGPGGVFFSARGVF